jgi:hypothetical protein
LKRKAGMEKRGEGVKEIHNRERERMTKVIKSQKKAQQSRNTLLIEVQHHYSEQGDSWFL